MTVTKTTSGQWSQPSDLVFSSSMKITSDILSLYFSSLLWKEFDLLAWIVVVIQVA